MSQAKVRKVSDKFKDEDRTGKMDVRDRAFLECTTVISESAHHTFNVLTLPCKDWILEDKLVHYMPRTYGNKKVIELHSFEYDDVIYQKSKENIPHSLKAESEEIISEEGYNITKSRYFENNIFIHQYNLFDYLANVDKMFDFMWLDLTNNIYTVRHKILHAQNRMNANGILILSFYKGREPVTIPDRVQYACNILTEMTYIDTMEYKDSSPMVNVILRKKITEQELESYIDMGQEQIIKQPNTNKMQNLENNDQVAVIATESKGKSLRIVVEKLDGGYVSDIQGKRRIYTKTDDIIDMIGMDDILNKLEHDQYHVNIDFIPKDEYQEQEDLRALISEEKILSLAEAKEAGVIEEADKFSPYKVVDVIDEPIIKVDASNCYSTSRLKSISWKEWGEQMELSIVEMAKIAGLKKETFYNTWANVIKGSYKYQRTDIKIGLTVLAKYFEKNLDVRTSTQDKCEKMKGDLLKLIRDVELIGGTKSHIKTSDVAKKLVEMRKVLL